MLFGIFATKKLEKITNFALISPITAIFLLNTLNFALTDRTNAKFVRLFYR